MYYLFKVFSLVFLGEPKHPAPERSKSMVYVVAVLAVLSLAAGLFVAYPTKLTNIATTQMSWWLR
jgi:NADH:ubiquinone oxidoreductase subunit 5 (subunit L)/multisubunit Na+/H+ antiporter MnhA subunit